MLVTRRRKREVVSRRAVGWLRGVVSSGVLLCGCLQVAKKLEAVEGVALHGNEIEDDVG